MTDFLNLYNRGYSIKSIAALMRCAEATARLRLQVLGATIREPGRPVGLTAECLAAALELRALGYSWRQCSKRVGFSTTTLRRAVQS